MLFYVISSIILFYPSLVQRLAIFGSVLQMLVIGASEVVGAAEVFFGAHIQIVVLHIVEHGINASN